MDCPDGQLGKDKILDMYSMILPVGNAKLFVDQIFRIFDKDGNGTIDFKEFMMATDMTASGSPEEKLRSVDGGGFLFFGPSGDGFTGTAWRLPICDFFHFPTTHISPVRPFSHFRTDWLSQLGLVIRLVQLLITSNYYPPSTPQNQSTMRAELAE